MNSDADAGRVEIRSGATRAHIIATQRGTRRGESEKASRQIRARAETDRRWSRNFNLLPRLAEGAPSILSRPVVPHRAVPGVARARSHSDRCSTAGETLQKNRCSFTGDALEWRGTRDSRQPGRINADIIATPGTYARSSIQCVSVPEPVSIFN